MRKKKNFRRKPKKQLQGLQVEVYDGQVEKAIRILKKKVKESNLFLHQIRPQKKLLELKKGLKPGFSGA